MAEDKALKVSEVAVRFRVSDETVRRWLRDGKLKGIRLGGTKSGYRVLESEVDRVLRGEVAAR